MKKNNANVFDRNNADDRDDEFKQDNRTDSACLDGDCGWELNNARSDDEDNENDNPDENDDDKNSNGNDNNEQEGN